MEVTSSNFERLFPDLIDAYLRSSIIAIDCEFSGVRSRDTKAASSAVASSTVSRKEDTSASAPGPSGPEEQPTQVLAPEERAYGRLKSAAQKYTVLQLGITFAWLVEGMKHSQAHRAFISQWTGLTCRVLLPARLSRQRRRRGLPHRIVQLHGQPLPRLVHPPRRQDLQGHRA
jgi:hypothetical protein